MFDIEEAKHLAELSKIEFTDDELCEMANDMSDIISLMDKVREFNDNDDPYTPPSVDYSALRCDNHNNSSDSKSITQNAKNVKNNSFVVPKVV